MPPDPPQTILHAIRTLMDGLPAPVNRKIHVSEHVHRFLTETYTKALSPAYTAKLDGIDIVVEPDLTGGQWQIRENGEVATSGDMAPALNDETVSYHPIFGWTGVSNCWTLNSPATT